MIRTWISKLPRLQPTQWTWVIAALLAGFVAYYRDMTASSSENVHEPEPLESAATFIPAGFVLVPIEVANYESLDSILGKFGTVDLYIPPEDPKKKARKVAERIRILRAPLNPSQFAVLAREEDSPKLVSHDGPFLVVVQNPSQAGTGIVTSDRRESKRRTSRITVEVTQDEKNDEEDDIPL